MIRLTINGSSVQVEEGSTLLEAARLYGIPVPTLCHDDGLSAYGASGCASWSWGWAAW